LNLKPYLAQQIPLKMNKTNYHLDNNLKLKSARNIIVLLLIVIAALGGFLLGGNSNFQFLLIPIVLLCLINFLFLHYIFRHMVHMKDNYNQLTEFIQLKEKVGGEMTLPVSRGYAASPDFLNEILETIKQTQPKKILEASCGISTISISEFLIKNNLSEVEHIALEHDDFYAKKCQAKVRNSKSQVVVAPITEHNINSKKWKWYSTEAVKDFQDIDLYIIDGPPHYLQKNSRYPALPIMIKNLSRNCVVLLDDSYRPQEREILEMWKKEFQMDYEILWSEKGIGRLTYNV